MLYTFVLVVCYGVCYKFKKIKRSVYLREVTFELGIETWSSIFLTLRRRKSSRICAGLPWWLGNKELPYLLPMQETQVQSLGQEDPLEKEMATYSSSLAREILWTEEPGGLQSMEMQRVGHDLVTVHRLPWITFPFLRPCESRHKAMHDWMSRMWSW